MTDDDDILAAARGGFLEEANQLLHEFEECLLGLESAPQDSELLNAAFRAAHTIKGTAGLFGFDAVVAFTHEVETLMEALRSEQLSYSESIAAALLEARDQIGHLLDEVRQDRETRSTCDPAVLARSACLSASLRILLGHPAAAAATLAATGQPPSAAAASTPIASADGRWQLSLRFGIDALRNGLDPLAFIRYLGSVGTVHHIDTFGHQLPDLAELDPESCHLGFEIRLHSDAGREAIEQVFEFAVDDCSLRLLAPDASASDFLALLAERTEGDAAARAALRQIWQRQGVMLLDQPDAADLGEPSGPTARVAQTPAADPGGAPATPSALASATPAARERRTEETRYLRVSADKLDRLIDLVGELVIAGSGAQLVAQREKSQAFSEAAQRIHDLVQEARDGALSLRMVPIGETFARFQRVVRDVSKALGKSVELEITGGDTELDKSMVESVADPLMHLVRNSLDHGIEPGDERSARGKNPRGRLALNAFHESGQIVIEVSDDGRGLARERILAKAIERGLVDADAELSDTEVNQLIFAPGFSTAEQVTDISGRGVGMDVVKRNIDALRGQIHIASQPGRGTTMQIRLPLTLAIIDGFLTSVGDVQYVLPLDSVVECIETPAACRERREGRDGTAPAHGQPNNPILAGQAAEPRLSGYFDLRGEVLPYVDMRVCFQIRAARPPRQSMLLVRTGNGKVGLLVDRLQGEHQTVLKPLGRAFQQLPGIAGSTILGSGEVALVLDVPSLMRLVTPVHAGRGSSSSGRHPGALA